MANKNYVCIGISTSGNSENVKRGLVEAKKIGCNIITFHGKDGGSIKELNGNRLIVPSSVTARIQEMHILIGYIICELVDAEF